MLTVLDEYTRQALAVEVRTRMGSDDVLEALYQLFLHHGKPEYVRSDNGPEFASKATQMWLQRVGVKPIRIYPGSPWENGYNERFNGTLRREVLNAEWFATTKQAQIVINCWLNQYNQLLAQPVQPHPSASGAEHATTNPRNSTQKWPIRWGLDMIMSTFRHIFRRPLRL
jgi:transposase InsO family protein